MHHQPIPSPPSPCMSLETLARAAHVLGCIARELETAAPDTRAFTYARTALAAGYDGEPTP